MHLIRRVDFGTTCWSATHYSGQIYAGLVSGISVVMADSLSYQPLVFDDAVASIIAHEDVIYALQWSFEDRDWSTAAYDTQLQPIRSWKLAESDEGSQKDIGLHSGNILTPDRCGKTIMEYSLTGELMREISCPSLQYEKVYICLASNNDMILSSGCVVSRIDLSTGDSRWSVESLERPTAVCCNSKDRVYVAVAGGSSNIPIAILNGETDW